MDKEKSQVKAEIVASKPDQLAVVEPKEEKTDNLLAADHKPDTLGDNEKPEKVSEKEKENDKSEKDKDRSPRKSGSKSHERSRYVNS